MKAGDKYYVWEIYDLTDHDAWVVSGVEDTYERAERVGISVREKLTDGEKKYRVAVHEKINV